MKERENPTAIIAVDLGKTYRGGVRALDRVSFSVRYGEVFGYLGRNGSGKTTTVRILATLTIPSAGTASVAGHDVVTDAAAVRNAVGVTMQVAGLDSGMTGREHLEFIAGLRGYRRREATVAAIALLDEFDLGDAADRLIATYSGGTRRRLDLASALIAKPRVLFLDEPTTGLDAQSRRALWSRIEQLRSQGVAVFLTTQYIEEADILADRVAFLDAGRIVATDRPAVMKNRFGQTALRLRPADLSAVRTWAERTGVALEAANRGLVQITVGDADQALAMLRQMREEDIRVESFEVVLPSLEDVFIGITRHGIPVADTVSPVAPGAVT